MSTAKNENNRREFLASLLAVNATRTIGVSLAQASPSQPKLRPVAGVMY